ncbi:MAG TPA: S8 family serine peptidase [Terriglobales bacterium]|nr:S8 family serine peptidase [Terriglobales bacterium]
MKRFLFGLALMVVGTSGFAQVSKIAKPLHGRRDNDATDVIVQFTSVPGARHREKILARGGTVKDDLAFIKALHASIPASRLDDLSEDGEVTYISPNRPIRSALNNTTGAVLANYPWSLGLDGEGVGVAVIDSGVRAVEDLRTVTKERSRVLYNFDAIGGGTDDLYGHGTHVAGIIAGNAAASSCPNCDTQLQGVAPNATILNFHALGQNGAGTDTSVINAIYQAIQVKHQYNIRVMNLSVGRPVYESYKQDPLCQAVEAAWNAGIVVVVAAGNDGRDNSFNTNGYGTINAPGNDPYVITVGAMNTMGTPDRGDDVMTTYSSKGPTAIDHIVKPDIVAPGNKVISLQAHGSTLAKEYPANVPAVGYYHDGNGQRPSPNYFTLSGTSMAAPVVSAAAALLIQRNPRLTPDQVKARLMKSAYKTFPRYTTITDSGTAYTIQYDAFTVGAGYLDLQAAFSEPQCGDQKLSAKSPTAVYDRATKSVHFVRDSSALWGSAAMWGSSTVWGANAFVGSRSTMWGSSALWGSSAMWGSSTTGAFSALWGSSAMWGSGTNTPDPMSIAVNGDN